MHSAPVYDSGPSASPYESMPPSAAPHSDLGYYNQSQYGAPPAQEHAYSNGNYNGPPAASAPPPPVYGANPYGAAPNGYDQPYRGYEGTLRAPVCRPFVRTGWTDGGASRELASGEQRMVAHMRHEDAYMRLARLRRLDLRRRTLEHPAIAH
jgi:hypothetical protein